MKNIFKILIVLILVVAFSSNCLALSTYKDSSGKSISYDEDLFEFGKFNATMHPNVNYFVPMYFDNALMTDSFFAEFTTRFGFVSDCDISNLKFKNLFDIVEWVRDSQGRYYLHIVVKSSTSKKDYSGQIIVYATSRIDSDYRAASILDVSISMEREYSTGSSSVREENTEIDFVCDGGLLYFDKSLDGKFAKVNIGDGTIVSFKIDYQEKYNILYDDYVSDIIKIYNPKAKIRQYSFYQSQTFSTTCNVKFKVKNGERYLYELSSTGKLTYLGGDPSEVSTMGVGTNRLGTYILSDILLDESPYFRVSDFKVDTSRWVANPNTGVKE